MEIKKFQYLKEDKVEDKEIVLLWQDDKYFEGIDITKLSEKEVEELKQVLEENKEKIKPFYKGYRKYKRDKVLKEDDNDNMFLILNVEKIPEQYEEELFKTVQFIVDYYKNKKENEKLIVYRTKTELEPQPELLED